MARIVPLPEAARTLLIALMCLLPLHCVFLPPLQRVGACFANAAQLETFRFFLLDTCFDTVYLWLSDCACLQFGYCVIMTIQRQYGEIMYQNNVMVMTCLFLCAA